MKQILVHLKSSKLHLSVLVALISIALSFVFILNIPNVLAAFPGLNGQIVYTEQDSIGGSKLYAVDSNGDNRTQISYISETDPAWSPDGQKIAFSSDRGATVDDYHMDIYVLDIAIGNQAIHRLTTGGSGEDNTEPAWSPDGEQIVFTSVRDGDPEIFIMDDDGSNQTKLTNNIADDAFPVWSPDGSKIAFASNRDDGNQYEIYVMDDDGGNPTRLTNNAYPDTTPNWSPDGTKIVFTSYRNGEYDIYMMDDDGDNEVRLTDNDSLDEYNPAWSPDGQKITFEAGGNLYVMDDDGDNVTQVSGITGASFTDWQPITPTPTP